MLLCHALRRRVRSRPPTSFFYSALERHERCFENGLTKECQTGNRHRLLEITHFAISLLMRP